MLARGIIIFNIQLCWWDTASLGVHWVRVMFEIKKFGIHDQQISEKALQWITIRLFLYLLQVSGSARNLDSAFLGNLVRGLVYLQVSSEEVPQGELRSQVLVNSDICRKRFPDLQQGGPMHGLCYHGDKEYFNGQSWISEDEKCSSCTCQVS